MWKACTERFFHINYIFPSKQRYVLALIKECKKIPNINRMVVFGSAVTGRCNAWSDIDVYFEMDSEPIKYPVVDPAISGKQVYDKFCNFTLSKEFIDKEILSKGVVVYERE